MKVILDTNFLIDFLRFRLDPTELRGKEVFVLRQSIFELERVARRGGKDAKIAREALVFAKALKALEGKEKNADLSLLAYSKDGYAIATQDAELKAAVRKAGGRVALIRQQKYIEWE